MLSIARASGLTETEFSGVLLQEKHDGCTPLIQGRQRQVSSRPAWCIYQTPELHREILSKQQ